MEQLDIDVRKQLDYEANVFAVCLLMPKDLLLAELNKDGGIDLSDSKSTRMKEICDIFGVSQQALVFRLNLLNKK